MAVLAYRRFVFAYGAAFALFYAVAHARGLALFTVYPSQAIVLLGAHRSRDVADPVLDFLAPEMYWYGWTASGRRSRYRRGYRASPRSARCVWVIPPMAMIACVILPWFRLYFGCWPPI